MTDDAHEDGPVPTALLLPGWGTSPERLRPLASALAAAGMDARPWAYDPVGSIESIGRLLAEAVEHAAHAATDDEVHLIGHSLGGLVAASAVAQFGAPVSSVTTVNSPWRGTWAAWTAHPGDPLGRELRWRADSLHELRRALAAHLADGDGPRWTIVSAALDLAAPPSSALRTPDGARLTKALVGVSGHSVSLLHPKLIDRVVAAVDVRCPPSREPRRLPAG